MSKASRRRCDCCHQTWSEIDFGPMLRDDVWAKLADARSHPVVAAHRSARCDNGRHRGKTLSTRRTPSLDQPR
jgi:hypothetical protein